MYFRFDCQCQAGWEGVTCQINTDDCLSNPCAGNSQCIDEVNGFTCVCAPGLTGKGLRYRFVLYHLDIRHVSRSFSFHQFNFSILDTRVYDWVGVVLVGKQWVQFFI